MDSTFFFSPIPVSRRVVIRPPYRIAAFYRVYKCRRQLNLLCYTNLKDRTFIMGKSKSAKINWMSDVEEHDYPAATSYLCLHYNERRVRLTVARLRKSPIVEFKAKDIFRATQLSLLGVSNSHVEKDLYKIHKGVSLSPVLLVRDENLGKILIADGYHRACAIYQIDEDAMIRCKITSS